MSELDITEPEGERAEPHVPRVGTLPVPVRIWLVVLGGTSVASLLAWVYGITSFHLAFLAVTLPGTVLLIATAILGSRDVRNVMAIGAIGGLVGTLLYDVVRIPFVVIGRLLVLSPIESYGVLASGADHSSPATDFVGWTYHFSNGIGFGVAYAAVALRRHWGWAVAYSMVLETATIVSPFADAYQLHGKYLIIAIAYGAHVPFGLALGAACQHPERTLAQLSAFGRRTAPVLVGVCVVVLALWLGPWRNDAAIDRATALDDRPSMAFIDGALEPEFVVTDGDGCAIVGNLDDEAHVFHLRDEPDVVVEPGAKHEVCVASGVHRVHMADNSFGGSFLIFDESRG